MQRRFWRLAFLTAFAATLPLLIGCGSGDAEVAEEEGEEEEAAEEEEEPEAPTKPTPKKTPAKAPAKTVPEGDGPQVLETKVYETSELPMLEDDAIAMDGGKFKIRAPQGWTLGSKQKGIVFRLYKQDKTGLPRLLLKAEDVAGEATTQDNVATYAETVKTAATKMRVQENIRPLVLGANAWVRVVDERSFQPAGSPEPIKVEVQSLHTIQNGRHYILELQTKKGELANPNSTERDEAYALAAGIEFKK